MTILGLELTGCGGVAPDAVLDNETLMQMVETSDEWIRSRTGIRQRRLTPPLSPWES